jgi:DNA-binding MarR family transcriptional regulator
MTQQLRAAMSRHVAPLIPRPHATASEESLLDAFHAATTAVRAILGETVSPMGLRVCQFWALNFIAEQGPVNGVHLADDLGVTPPSVTAAVQDLVDAGLVARERSDTDRRIVMLSATSRGRRTLGEIWSRLGVRMTERTNGLPHADLAAAARVLRAIGTRGPAATTLAAGALAA